MTIKDRVHAASKTSFAKYGLKSRELSTLVDQIIANRGLTDESKDEDVNGAITAFEPVVGLMQTMFNRAQIETEKKFEGWVDPSKQTPPAPPTPPTPPVAPEGALTAEQVQKMIAEASVNSQKAISDAVAQALAPYKEREEKARLTSLLQGNEKLKDIPEVFRTRYQLDKEENLDATVQKITDEWTALKQGLVSSGQYVEAPKATSKADEQNDFIKAMQGYSERNAPKPE